MDPLAITGTLIAVVQITTAVISICYDYRQGIKNASREVIQISDQLSSLKDVLDALLRLVENAESSDPSRLSTFELLAKPDGPLLTCKIELEWLKEKLEPEKGWRAVRQTLVWPLKEKEMTKALSSLERLKSTMQLAISADQATLSLAIRDNVEDLTQMFQMHSADQKRQDIYKWLAAPDPWANHITNRKKCQPRTGIWLLNSKTFKFWLSNSKSFLWLYGIPGSGKTVLCSTLIEHLVRFCQQIYQTAIAYFYFDFNDSGKRDISSLVRSLIIQLSAQCDSIPPPLLDLYQGHQSGAKSAEEAALTETLRDLVLIFHNVYIVFDALDESSNCEEVLQFIKTIQHWDLSRLHLLVTSRQLAEIEEALDDLVTDKLCLQDSKMNSDIFEFIVDQLGSDKKLAKWPLEIRAQIQQRLLQDEDGMFQWVVCQLDMFRKCMSIAAVRKALMTGLPKGLNATYEQILLGIDEEHQVEVMKTLQALTVAEYPLKIKEILEILAVDLDSAPPRFDPDSRLLDPHSILSMCSSLVTSTRTSISPFETSSLSLTLAHASVADYLTSSRSNGTFQFHFSRHSARQFMAQTCLVYLLNPELLQPVKPIKTEFLQPPEAPDKSRIKPRLKAFPFLKHVYQNWPLYLKKEPGDPEEHLEERTKSLLQTFFATSKLPNGGGFAFWVRMLIPSAPANFVQDTQPLYYAASFGLTEVVRIILETEKDIEIDALGGRARSSALHVSVYRNHFDVVKMLLERGADPTLPNNVHETPMYWARGGVKELLKQYGAVSTRDWRV